MAARQTKGTKVSKRTIQYTEALRERMMLFSKKNSSKVNRRDSQVLCFESSMKFRLGKAT